MCNGILLSNRWTLYGDYKVSAVCEMIAVEAAEGFEDS
jgi:hypothetical protein